MGSEATYVVGIDLERPTRPFSYARLEVMGAELFVRGFAVPQAWTSPGVLWNAHSCRRLSPSLVEGQRRNALNSRGEKRM